MTGRYQKVSLCFVSAVFLLVSSPAGTSAYVDLADGSFESSGTVSAGIPDAPGYWGGDLCEVVFSQNGITPHEGARMLRFAGTTPTGPAAGSDLSSICQMIDMRPHSRSIRSGQSRLVAAAYFNRVQGDQQTDTEFVITIDAFYGDPAGYPDPASITRTDSMTVHLGSDDDGSTWQIVTAELELPVNTEYVCIILTAVEDVFDDGDGDEFDGHYVDNAIADLFVPVGTGDSSWGGVKLLR